MRNTSRLILGELHRLVIYKILPISLLVAIFWVIILLFVSKEDALNVAPLFVIIDVCMMSILLIGASHHLEKQEGTIKSMMMMPISLGQILIAKFVASLVLGIESVIIISAALFFIHGLTFNYALLLFFIIIAGAVHAAIAFFLSLSSKDFSSMLVLLMAYLIPLGIPTMLFAFGMIDAKYEWILMLSPVHSSSNLITSAISGEFEVSKVIIGCVYLVLLTAALFKFAVYPKFKNNAVRG
ncbi:MAG TPA: ABC transporter permease [Syntrophaceticus sp.]|jgi:fluoroquinolone transport system permease protein|nr:ABC transporter permease [Syntrophaceticus sp.]